jgi:RNA polymerase sigma factor (sigma-70 family)
MNRDALIEQHMDVARRMAHFVHRIANYTVDIDDLIGEANYSLVKFARTWDGNTDSFAPLAGQRIRWDLIDYLRQHGPCSRTHDRASVMSLDSAPTPSVQPDTSHEFDSMVRRLSERYRHIFDLHFRQGWTMREVGADIGVTEGRVSQIVKRGIEQIGGDVVRERLMRRWAA